MFWTADASGAAQAAARGDVVVIVDVIDLSTSLEAALEAGAQAVYGASPAAAKAPVRLDPRRLGAVAGRRAKEAGAQVVVLAEPRSAGELELRRSAEPVLAGLAAEGARVAAVVPNLGAQVPLLAELKGRVVVGLSASGGVAFDAAFQLSPLVVTATIAPTPHGRGKEPALRGAGRAWEMALREGRDLTVVAASGRALEDVLASQYLAGQLLTMGT